MKDIVEYMKLSREQRTAHLNLETPCHQIGGNSTQHRGALAHKFNTTIPKGRGIVLCHACNNAQCSNLRHLYWGTATENARDRVAFVKQGGVSHIPVLKESDHTDLIKYMELSRENRRAHLSLSDSCIERGGNSWEFRGLLAYFLKTTISARGALLCHACNNGKCSNPVHLYWGNSNDNVVLDPKEAGDFVGVWKRTVEKYGLEAAQELARTRDTTKATAVSMEKNRGVPKSLEHREKIAQATRIYYEKVRSGEIVRSHANALKRTDEQRERVSLGLKAYYDKLKEQGVRPKSYKATLSPEHKAKIGEASRKRQALLKDQKEAAFKKSELGLENRD